MKVSRIAELALGLALSAAAVQFADDFNREGPVHGGRTSDGRYTWAVFPKQVQAKIVTKDGRIVFNGSAGVMYIAHTDMRQRDFDLAFDYTYLSRHYARSLTVNYRLQGRYANARLSDGGYTGGYVLSIERPARAVLRLRLLKESAGHTKADTSLAAANVQVGNRWNVTSRVRLQVEGERHRVFIDDTRKPVIDVTDAEYVGPGWWNIADGGLTGRAIDNLAFRAGAPERAALPATAHETPAANSAQTPIDVLRPLYPIHYTGRVTPVPRRVLGAWRTLRMAPNGLNVEIDSGAHNAIRLARDLLLTRVADLSKTAGNDSGEPVTVYLGLLESDLIRGAAARLGFDLRGVVLQPQGYVIRCRGNTILAGGVDHRGAFYAAMTLVQSIGAPDGKLLLRCADLDDWPVWQRWYQSVYSIPDERGLLWLAVHKVRGIALQQREEWRNIRPDGKPQWAGRKWKNWAHVMRVYKDFKDRYDLLDYQLALHIYASGKRTLPMLDITNEKHIAQLIEACAFAAGQGFDHIMVCADDWTPLTNGRYVCPYPAERKRFHDSVGRAHGTLMRRLHDALKARFPDLDLAFVPAPYSIYSHGVPDKPSHQRYLRDLAAELPDDVYIVWTGPNIRSRKVTRQDFLLWESLVNNHRSYLWDNSAGPAPISRWDTTFYDGFDADSQGVIFINGDPFGKSYRLSFGIATSDYLWDPKAYDPAASFRDAVEKMYGPGTAGPAERFMADYAELTGEAPEREKALKLLDELDALSKTMAGQGWSMHQIRRRLRSLRAQFQVVVPALDVPRITTPPVLDGRLDDASWQNAALFDFRPVSGKKEPISPAWCRITYDAGHLYLGFRAQRTVPLKKVVRVERDRNLWAASDDLIEVFLQGEKGAYAQLVFDSAGNRWDAEFGLGLHLAWDPKWRVAVHRETKVWSAEVAIPFTSLGPVIEAPVKPGTVWRANFFRQLLAEKQQSAWSPTKGNRFHTKAFFGQLRFR
ncbi:MAG: hypothetical protein GXP31_04060 [Kiritimatiellaeota bacterium]|nr:hypothetical protein [Kiritimatiellota bacterium]